MYATPIGTTNLAANLAPAAMALNGVAAREAIVGAGGLAAGGVAVVAGGLAAGGVAAGLGAAGAAGLGAGATLGETKLLIEGIRLSSPRPVNMSDIRPLLPPGTIWPEGAD